MFGAATTVMASSGSGVRVGIGVGIVIGLIVYSALERLATGSEKMIMGKLAPIYTNSR